MFKHCLTFALYNRGIDFWHPTCKFLFSLMTLVEYFLSLLKTFEIDTCQMFVNIQHYPSDPSSGD